MKFKNKFARFVSSFAAVTVSAAVLLPTGASASLTPYTAGAVFDIYGNTFQNFNIDVSTSVFDDNANGGLVLSDRPTAEAISSAYDASSLNGVHPRLLATQADFSRIKSSVNTDATLYKFYSATINNANDLLSEPCLVWELRDGERLWFVSQDFIDRMLTLGMAYRLTGDCAYALRGWQEMNAIALFDTWHPEHHIDVGGLSVGFAIGYDWLYDYFSPEQRQALERAANRLCFAQYCDGLHGRSSDMSSGILAENNHNAVMNSGGIMMAAAFYDVNPEICSHIISSLIRATEYTVDNLMSDGSWYEGISYATMMIEFYSMELATLNTIFGSMFGLQDVEGTSKAAEFVMNLQCNTSSFSYGDGSQGKFYDPGILYMLDSFDKDSRNFESSLFSSAANMSKTVRTLLWYKGENVNKTNLPTEVLYNDRNSVATARSSWNSLIPTYVGFKGGRPADTHGHMDIGSFCFYSGGTQWTHDPGAESYTVDGYFDSPSSDSSNRWTHYRTRAEAHSCLVVNPDSTGGYVANSKSSFSSFQSNKSNVIAVLNMTPAYGTSRVDAAKRGYWFCDNRQSLVIRDEITPLKDGNAMWFMSTKQTPVIVDSDTVKLTDTNGKSLTIDFVSDADFELELTAANRYDGTVIDGDNANNGIYRIVATIATKSYTPFAFTAKLTPNAAIGAKPASDYATSIDNWALPAETNPVVSITSEAKLSYLPAGTDFSVDVSAYGASSTDVLTLFEVDADGVETPVEVNPYHHYNVTASYSEKYLIAKLTDASGNLISTSERFSLMPDTPQSTIDVWNVDFDDEKVNDNGSSVYICDNSGNILKSLDGSGKTINAHYENGKSVVELVDDPLRDGRSIYLKSTVSSNNNDMAQLNEFRYVCSDGVVVSEMDFLFKDYNALKDVLAIECADADGSKFWACTPQLSTDGKFNFGNSQMDMELNCWHNVKLVHNIKEGHIMCIVDGRYFGSVTHKKEAVQTTRCSFRLYPRATTEAYADNFKVTNFMY